MLGHLFFHLLDEGVGLVLHSPCEEFMLVRLFILELLDVEFDAVADSQVPVVLHEFDDLALHALVVVALLQRFHLSNYYQISMLLRILKTSI